MRLADLAYPIYNYIVADLDGTLLDLVEKILVRAAEYSPKFAQIIAEKKLASNWRNTQKSYAIHEWLDETDDTLCEKFMKCGDASEDFYESIKPFETLRQVLLRKQLHIISKVYGGLEVSKEKWIKKYYPNATYDLIPLSENKSDYLHKNKFKDGHPLYDCSAILEDSGKEIERYRKYYNSNPIHHTPKLCSPQMILIDYRYNQHIKNTSRIKYKEII